MGDFAQSSPAATNNLRDTLRLRVLAVKAADNPPRSFHILRLATAYENHWGREGTPAGVAGSPRAPAGAHSFIAIFRGFAFAHPPAMLPAPSQGARAKM